MKNLFFLAIATLLMVALMIVLPIVGNTRTVIEKSIINEDLSLEVVKKDASDENSKDGYIYIKIAGGVAPYTINCFSPYSTPTQNKGNELKLENIKSGDYLFLVQDSSGKTITKEVKISNQK